MKKAFGVIALAGTLAMAIPASAQFTSTQDFEGGTANGALPSAWGAYYSGTSTGNIVAGSSIFVYSDEQKNGGNLSGKIGWTWLEPSTNPPKRVRIQPGSSSGWITANNGAVDRTSTPYVGFYLYGANQGDEFALYMGEAANGGGPYEAFAYHPITWTGWQIIEHNLLTDPVTGYLTGNGTLPATCSMSGLAINPPTANPGTTAVVLYYVDDFGFSATARGGASVSDWSVY